ncbi:hypothetical protein [Thalassomonas haliotis]|uniref:Uncharacterized protein n=1 Tax=Thalassomonas haliotis TaxID=485448 RepID=A0ABY7VHY0_9GAMM|nr:hypothetical protein [Thalassomonas haliotis]WDE13334.1 hypothetical protein H3N35_07810 [Thalassomonas haliotis]
MDVIGDHGQELVFSVGTQVSYTCYWNSCNNSSRSSYDSVKLNDACSSSSGELMPIASASQRMVYPAANKLVGLAIFAEATPGGNCQQLKVTLSSKAFQLDKRGHTMYIAILEKF